MLTRPRRFGKTLTLGLIVALEGRYLIISNRESGEGRYDVSLEPLYAGDDGILLEFKVQDPANDLSFPTGKDNPAKFQAFK